MYLMNKLLLQFPILKFIDQHNTDGSYTCSESADGTYKLETRLETGEVRGKYGYIDEDGNLKETSYGADTVNGFVPTKMWRETHSIPLSALLRNQSDPDFAPPLLQSL